MCIAMESSGQYSMAGSGSVMTDVPMPPGQPKGETQRVELAYWSSHVDKWNQHLPTYRRIFPFANINYATTKVLDVGSGPVSVFEEVAPKDAVITPYDTLAIEYNRLTTHKRFPVVPYLQDERYGLITLFNCLDHMDRPAELLERLSQHLEPDGIVWICCHINRPFEPDAHPQDFRFWQLIATVDRIFRLQRCGLARDGILFPYVWWGICGLRTRHSPFIDLWRRTLFTSWCALHFARFHGVRALVKSMKMVGLRPFLPPVLRF